MDNKKITTCTIERIESLIAKEEYHHHDQKITHCILTLENGFKVSGLSGVVDTSKFNKELGEKYAKENAINKMWELEGYRLQWELWQSAK